MFYFISTRYEKFARDPCMINILMNSEPPCAFFFGLLFVKWCEGVSYKSYEFGNQADERTSTSALLR